MWVIRHEVTHQYFQDFQPRPHDDTPIWVDDIGQAKTFNELEAEEDFRGIYLPGANAQPFEVP